MSHSEERWTLGSRDWGQNLDISKISGHTSLCVISIDGPVTTYIATIPASGHREKRIARAQLIAAAPKLLDACEMIKNRLLTYGEWDDGCFYYAGHSASELQEPLRLIEAAIAEAEVQKP